MGRGDEVGVAVVVFANAADEVNDGVGTMLGGNMGPMEGR